MRLTAPFALTVALALTPLARAADTDPLLAQADQLLARGQAQAAFDLLAPLEDERAGNPDYDYLLGLAALETGQGGIAAFAFERCLAVDPKNGPCRVQMARTHLALGENGSARIELETVKASAPPREVDELVSRYLGTVARREAGERRRVAAHVQAGMGYDSNVTSTTEQTQIAIPSLGGLPFTLTGVSTKQEDPFAQAEAGLSVDQALSPAWRLQAGASLAARQYQDVEAFSSLASDASVGLTRSVGANTMGMRLHAQDYRLDEEGYRSVYGASLQYQHSLDDTAAASVYAQGSHLDYHLGNPDADRFTVGVGYSRLLGADRASALYAGLYAGNEDSESTLPGYDQDFAGLRLGGSHALDARLALTASLSLEQRRFDGADITFQVEREDTATDLNLGAILQLRDRLSLRPAYTYTRSDSNAVLSDYERHLVAIDLRLDI